MAAHSAWGGWGCDLARTFAGAILYQAFAEQFVVVVGPPNGPLAQAYSGAFIFDPTRDLLVDGLTLPDISCQSDTCVVVPPIFPTSDGIGTFAFSQTPTTIPGVPEPATWAILLIGFAALVFVTASRRRLVI